MHSKWINKDRLVTCILLGIVLVTCIILVSVYYQDIVSLLSFNFEKNLQPIFEGLLNTVLITMVSFALGLILGIITCLIDGIPSQNTVVIILKKIFKVYVSVFRGTPMMVQLLIIYFVIFSSFSGDPMYVAMLSFGLNSGAYVSEIIRGGINSVPNGQMEAGRSLGLSYPTVMRKIIFPQAIRNSLPSLGNEFITLIKETSIAGFIGAFDLTLAFRKIANATFDYNTVYIVMGIAYFVIVGLITIGLTQLERKLIKNAHTK